MLDTQRTTQTGHTVCEAPSFSEMNMILSVLLETHNREHGCARAPSFTEMNMLLLVLFDTRYRTYLAAICRILFNDASQEMPSRH
jgi:hypothetical protein